MAPNRLMQASCCLMSAVNKVYADNDIPTIDKMIPSHKGADDECEDCTGIWVSVGESREIEVDIGGECHRMREWTFQLDVLRKCSTESLVNCGAEEPGCGDLDENGCHGDITIEPPVEPCTQDKPSITGESAFFWNERYHLEKQLVKAWQCCLEDCYQIRCQGASLGIVTEETLGGCHYLTLELSVSF